MRFHCPYWAYWPNCTYWSYWADWQDFSLDLVKSLVEIGDDVIDMLHTD